MARNIMIQGTMSSAGKSFIVAGLCRIFKQDGYLCAPFKSQNMALNSFVTKDGLEIGRAQAMQAEAAGIPVQAQMNPILLKPDSDTGTQIVLNGKVYGNMRAMEYFSHKTQFIPEILKAYAALDRAYDIIVIEGAGSPAEINLKQNDIVNMGLAKLVDAPVLLCGDIDRGGVFASLYGTVKLLERDEQERIKGILINKFRGDIRLLDTGLRMIEELLHIPVLGCIPMRDIDLEDEDSLSGRLYLHREKNAEKLFRIAVIHYPHISNFTDFQRLENVQGVELSYIQKPGQLEGVDLIILPGSKNTIADLQWLYNQKFDAGIQGLQKQGTAVLGICGGYQMLGEKLVEGQKEYAGLGILPLHTIFGQEKLTERVTGRLSDSGEEIDGYEIHMGMSSFTKKVQNWIELSDGRNGGIIDREKAVVGTYLHGILDHACILWDLVGLIRKKDFCREQIAEKIRMAYQESHAEYKERQYNLLADLLREFLDMERIYSIIG